MESFPKVAGWHWALGIGHWALGIGVTIFPTPDTLRGNRSRMLVIAFTPEPSRLRRHEVHT